MWNVFADWNVPLTRFGVIDVPSLAEDFEEVFTTLCKRYDSPDWDTDVLRSALESEIAAALDVSIHTVRVMLDAEMAGRELVIPETEVEPDAG